jgi:nucleoside-diphosphate-sugar epimerase
MHSLADISETQRVLGYTPKVRFWDGFEITLKWWGLA